MRCLIILFTLYATGLQAQDCLCRQDLRDYATKVQQTISYEKQSKEKQVKQRFQQKLKALQDKITCEESRWDCFLMLTELKDVIRDEHSRIMGTGLGKDVVDTLASDYYRSLPRLQLNLDSLKTSFTSKTREEVAGIYKKGKSVYAVLRQGDSYLGVILESESNLWQPGMVAFKLDKSYGDRFRISYIKGDLSGMRSLNAERIVDGRFLIYGIAKAPDEPYHYEPSTDKTYSYEQIESDIGYMRFATFSWKNGNVAKAKSFIEKTFPTIDEPHVIIDLRNNGGGTDQIAKPFRKAVRKLSRKHKIYILINGKSGSNAEQTAARLSELDNVLLLGDTSLGVINYGLNYGEKITLDSGRFAFYKTDLDYKKFLQYEGRGVPVTVPLKATSDWIAQTVNYIQQQQ